MKQEELIKKWLNYELNSQELEDFQKLENYDSLVKLSEGVQGFKADSFDTEEELQKVLETINTKKQTKVWWSSPLLRVAAMLVFFFGIYHYTTTLDTNVSTYDMVAQNKKELFLPDNSSVTLNAKTTLSYNKSKWNSKRDVNLNGEAYFKVAKGSTFNVITPKGTVTVYGTQFNVKQRENYFEVICYEGLVGVDYYAQQIKLRPGDSFLIIDGKLIAKEKESRLAPSWINNESYFKSLPFKEVLSEFERQYDVTIKYEEIDSSQLFTGSFTHEDIQLALKSITLPLNLRFEKTGNTVTLKRD